MNIFANFALMNHFRFSKTCVAITSLLLVINLVACGGGGDSGTNGNGASALSATQQTFETAILGPAAEGFNAITMGMGTTVVNGVSTLSFSTFFRSNFSLDHTPFNSSPANLKITLDSFIAKSVSVAYFDGTLNVTSIAKDGSIVKTYPTTAYTTSYEGGHVVLTYLTTTGAEISSLRFETLEKIPLSGDVRTSMMTLMHTPSMPPATNTNNFLPGSTYYKTYIARHADSVNINNTAQGATSTAPPTNIEAALPYISTLEGRTYAAADGNIINLNNTRIFVANTPMNCAICTASETYSILAEVNGKVYSGTLQKAGTLLKAKYSNGDVENYFIRINNAASNSINATWD
jgi:hypothetical protein